MTLTKMQAGLGLATVILTIVSIIGGAVTRLETRFAALDTRLGKLESAIKTLNATTPDERYKQLVNELIVRAPETLAPGGKWTCTSNGVKYDCVNEPDAPHRFGKSVFPADAGAAANMPSTKPPQ